jgi:hypothetical protein
MSGFRFLGRLAPGLLLAACGSTPALPRAVAPLPPVEALRLADFPGAAAILDGIAAPDADPRLRVGDAALFALEFRRGDAIHRQLLLLEIDELPAIEITVDGRQRTFRRVSEPVLTSTVSRTKQDEHGATTRETERTRRSYRVDDAIVRFRRYDADGKLLADARATLYEQALAAGWWCDTQADATEEQRDMAALLTHSMRNLANEEPTLRELLFEIVDAPGLWSVATHLGVQVDLMVQNRDLESYRSAALAYAGTTMRLLSMDVDINGDAALFADLLAIPPRGATLVCGGLVGAVARHPREPGRDLAVRLVATRRGRASG